MKKPFVLAVILVLLAMVTVLSVKYDRQSDRFAASRRAEESVRAQFNTALESIAEIQDSLDAIVPEEAPLRGLGQTPELGSASAQSQKERMLTAIGDLKESIRFSGQRIRDLEKSLHGSQAEVAGLKRVIDNLKRSVAEKEALVQRLTLKVDSLSIAVAGLQSDVVRGEAVIAEQADRLEENRREMGTIHYVMGERKELKQKGIIEERGGLLGIGKTPQLTGRFSPAEFAALDTGTSTEIAIPRRDPRVLTAQARASYELVPAGEGVTLHILDPREFRKVKYLVILLD